MQAMKSMKLPFGAFGCMVRARPVPEVCEEAQAAGRADCFLDIDNVALGPIKVCAQAPCGRSWYGPEGQVARQRYRTDLVQ